MNDWRFLKCMTIFIITVFCLACSSASGHTLLKGVQYPPTSHVEVLFEVPSRPYEAFALVEARSYTVPRATIPDLINELKRRAASIGADAIILSEKTGEIVYLGGQTAPTLSATAMKFK